MDNIYSINEIPELLGLLVPTDVFPNYLTNQDELHKIIEITQKMKKKKNTNTIDKKEKKEAKTSPNNAVIPIYLTSPLSSPYNSINSKIHKLRLTSLYNTIFISTKLQRIREIKIHIFKYNLPIKISN